MKNEKDKIREPFTPENTPNPPQVIDPNKRNDDPGENQPRKMQKGPSSDDESQPKKKKPETGKEQKKVSAESGKKASDESAGD